MSKLSTCTDPGDSRLRRLAAAGCLCLLFTAALTGCPSASNPTTSQSGAQSPSGQGASTGGAAGSAGAVGGASAGAGAGGSQGAGASAGASSAGASSAGASAGVSTGSSTGASAGASTGDGGSPTGSSAAGEPGFGEAAAGAGLPDLSDAPAAERRGPAGDATADSTIADGVNADGSSPGYGAAAGLPGVDPAGTGGSMSPGEQVAILDAQLEQSTGEFDAMILDTQREQQQAARERGPPPARSGTSSGGDDTGGRPYGDMAGAAGSTGSGMGTGGGQAPANPAKYPPPADIPSGDDDDVVARQLREAAMREPDPAVREKLWQEYRKYKGVAQ